MALFGTGLLASAALFPGRSTLERALVALLLANGAAIGAIELLSLFGAIGRPGLVTCAAVLVVLAVLAAGSSALRVVREDLRRLGALAGRVGRSATLTASTLVAVIAIALAVTAAWLLAPWAWESLAYHLPISNDALQTHALASVPTHIVYASAYPHLGAVYLTAFRLALGHDALAETVQLPFAAQAVVAIALAARREGVSSKRALALALLFVAVPAVTLELASCEVDVMFAALVMTSVVLASGPLDAPAIGLSALSLGLALGTDPSSPVVILVAFATLVQRGLRGGRAGEVLFAMGVVASVGGWTYLENLLLHGNPLWPVRVGVLGLEIDGLTTFDELASRGTSEPFASASWAERLLESWTSPLEPRPSFDMRRGGLGPLFTLGLLPLAFAAAASAAHDARSRARLAPIGKALLPMGLATLLSPQAFWARYTLLLAGVGLAIAAVATDDLPRRWRRTLDVALVVLALGSVWHASSGFTVDGPSLADIAALPEAEREAAYGIDLDERPWSDARARVGHGEAFAYDPSFNLPGRLFPAHQHGRVVYLEAPGPTADELVELVEREHIESIVLGDGPHFTGAEAARSRPDRFRELAPCAPSLGDPCVIFAVGTFTTDDDENGQN